MKRARRFCLDGDNAIFFGSYNKKENSHPFDVLVKIKGVSFLLFYGQEGKSVAELLEMWGDFIKALKHFGITLKYCIQDNIKTTIQAVNRCSQNIMECKKERGYTTSGVINDWKSLLRGAGKNPPEELRNLLEETIRELERVETKDKQSPRKRKSKRR